MLWRQPLLPWQWNFGYFCTKSPISWLVWQIDRRCLGLPGGFWEWPIQWNHAKCCGADPCCHGNEIWASCRDPVTYRLVRCKNKQPVKEKKQGQQEKRQDSVHHASISYRLIDSLLCIYSIIIVFSSHCDLSDFSSQSKTSSSLCLCCPGCVFCYFLTFVYQNLQHQTASFPPWTDKATTVSMAKAAVPVGFPDDYDVNINVSVCTGAGDIPLQLS